MEKSIYFPPQVGNALDQVFYIQSGKRNPATPFNADAIAKAISDTLMAGGRIVNDSNVPELGQLITSIQDNMPKGSVDMVNQPAHYKIPGLGVEWLDVRTALTRGIPVGIPYPAVTHWSEAVTYLARMWRKNGLEDARKARFYVNKLIEELEAIHEPE